MGNHRSSDAGLLETLSAEDETLRAGNRKSSGTNASEWLVNIADDLVVPMITSELVEALHVGRVTNRSLVWRIGMHDWSPLAEVPQLRLAAGPSALPPAASTPGPVIHKSLLPPEQRRRATLPFGLPAATPVNADSGALAVYDRPAPSLTFADSMRSEWPSAARADARARPPTSAVPAVPPVPPPPVLSRPRLTPVPPVTARLPERALRVVASNTLAPTTTEGAAAATGPSSNPWGDLSVVLASELRAEKKATKRLMLWAGVGSAVVASLFTLWVSRSMISRSSAPLTQAAQAALPAAPVESQNSAASAALLAATPEAAVTPAPTVTPPPPAVAAKPRVVARPKRKALAPASSAGSNAAPPADSAEEKPSSGAAALPSATADATAPAAPSSVAPAIQQPDPSAPPAASSGL